MTPRFKKLVGLLILLPALLRYFGAVVTFSDRLPNHWLIKLVYFLFTGLVWAAPVIPFIRWMEREPADKKKGAE